MNSTRKLILAAILAALVFSITYFTKIPIPYPPGAYAHAGDSIIYLSGMMLGGPWAAAVAALGSVFADLLAAPIYIPATLVIKAVMGGVAGYFLYRKSDEKPPIRKTVLGLAIPALFMAAGYYLYEVVILGYNWLIDLQWLVANFAQGAVGIALYLPLSAAVRRILPRV
jgi:uncharacterized membrane protein